MLSAEEWSMLAFRSVGIGTALRSGENVCFDDTLTRKRHGEVSIWFNR